MIDQRAKEIIDEGVTKYLEGDFLSTNAKFQSPAHAAKTAQMQLVEPPYPRKSKVQVSNIVSVGRLGNAHNTTGLINPMRCDWID